jgi:hypothetical protein
MEKNNSVEPQNVFINKRALHYSSAVGALMTLGKYLRETSRKRRMCDNLIEKLNERADIGEVSEIDVEIGKKVFPHVERFVGLIVEEKKIDPTLALASLITFNFDELGRVPTPILERFTKFLACWPEIQEENLIIVGHRIWQLMETEITFAEIEFKEKVKE